MSTTATLGSTGGRVCKAARLMLGLIAKKKPPKIRFEKIREIDWLHLRLQQFDKLGYETHAIAGNGNQVNLMKLAFGKKS